jgi:hypothetical protein
MRKSTENLARLVVSGSVGIGCVLCLAGYRWRARTAELIAHLGECSSAGGNGTERYAENLLEGLPAPTQRYFRAVLRRGQALPAWARFDQEGRFLLHSGAAGWRPFLAAHYVACGAPDTAGFVWDARIFESRVLPVRVRDAFVRGVGYMQASILGLATVADVKGNPEIAVGALQRYLAEAVWYPTALLPAQGVTWSPIDDTSARAVICAGNVNAALDFHFGEDGLIRRVFAPARPRAVGDRFVPTPWQGRFFDYEERGGMRIPVRGQVEWLLPGGPQVYWQGHVKNAVYGFVRTSGEN